CRARRPRATNRRTKDRPRRSACGFRERGKQRPYGVRIRHLHRRGRRAPASVGHSTRS
ncbi:MAG: hypothetical protein AVDCRST_MAG73-2596, partial [uncultured Thermomicrobiales bacterium]